MENNTMETLANWLEEAKQSAKRGMTNAKDDAFKKLYAARYDQIVLAQSKLRQYGQTPLEEFITRQKK